jgi:ABC-type transport system involved in multi-copper enzyme maturation permease subunit
MYFCDPILLGQLFDRMRLQLPEGIVNWLTPVWILCVGAAAGLLLCTSIWGVLKALSLIPGLNSIGLQRESKYISIGILTLLIFGYVLYAFPGILRPGQPAEAQAAAPAAGAVAPAANPNQTNLAQKLDQAWPLGGALFASWLLATALVVLVGGGGLAESWIAVREGVLWPLYITAIVMTVLAVIGLFIVRKPEDLLASLARVPALMSEGEVTQSHQVYAPPNPFDEPPVSEIAVSFRRNEIRELNFTSDQRIKVRTEPFAQQSLVATTFDVKPGEQTTWTREQSGSNPFRDEIVTKLYVKNFGTGPAAVTVTAKSVMAHPQMILVPWVAISMTAVFLFYLFQRAALPKLSAVALSTAKSEIAQPLFAIIMALGIFLLIVFIFVPYFTLTSDIKMLKDSGLSLILILCIIQAVWAASTSVADEVEGKTALTVLSKPVSRRDFILGKFAGIGWAVGLMIVMLGLVLLVTVAYKPIYDGREGTYTIQQASFGQTEATWQNCYGEMIQVIPGLVLAYLETLVMASLSVAISTRLPALANFLISASVYVLGHLTPLMVQSQVVAEQLPPVVFFGKLIATVLPVLDHFNVQASVAAGVNVPLNYLAWALVYCTLYSAVAMLLALTLFEDRDLA